MSEQTDIVEVPLSQIEKAVDNDNSMSLENLLDLPNQSGSITITITESPEKREVTETTDGKPDMRMDIAVTFGYDFPGAPTMERGLDDANHWLNKVVFGVLQGTPIPWLNKQDGKIYVVMDDTPDPT